MQVIVILQNKIFAYGIAYTGDGTFCLLKAEIDFDSRAIQFIPKIKLNTYQKNNQFDCGIYVHKSGKNPACDIGSVYIGYLNSH